MEGICSQANWVPAQTLVKCWPGSFKADTMVGVQTLLALAWERCPGTTTVVLAFSSLRTQGDGCIPSLSNSALQALGQHTGDGAKWGESWCQGVRVSHATASVCVGGGSRELSPGQEALVT